MSFMTPKLCAESAFWFGAWRIKFYAPKFGRYFLSALSPETKHWMKVLGNLETDSVRSSAHLYSSLREGYACGVDNFKEQRIQKQGRVS